MATLRDLRKRVRAVKNTEKITKAMKMVAASKLRRAQEAITQARPYALRMQDVLEHIVSHADLSVHPLLAARVPHKIELLILTSDRGLCGGFNSSIIRAGERFLSERGKEFDHIKLSTIGRKGRDHFKRRGKKIHFDYEGITASPTIEQADEISKDIAGRFQSGESDAVFLLYNEFKSAISQKVVVSQLLPIMDLEGWRDDPRVRIGELGPYAKVDTRPGIQVDLEPTPHGSPIEDEIPSETLEVQNEGFEHIFEPSRSEVLDALLPEYLTVQIFRAILESTAAEHGARMSAMDAASRNASEMIDRLTLQMNRARQAAITKELMEIIGGAEALKG